MSERALDLFEKMNLNPDDVTYTIVFSACAQLVNDRAIKVGEKLLNQIPNHFRNNNTLMTSAIHMLFKFGDVKRAEDVFESMNNKGIISYGVMMKGYNINNEPTKCLNLFQIMKQENIVPNDTIFNLVIGACSQIGMFSLCKLIVDQIPSNSLNELYISNSLVDMWVSNQVFFQ
jgi:pentatricopeptide repeat protein